MNVGKLFGGVTRFSNTNIGITPILQHVELKLKSAILELMRILLRFVVT